MPWIGRYRSVVAAMIRYANVSQRLLTEHLYHSEFDVTVSPQEWQVLEYLLEHPNNSLCMAAIADKLGMVPSTFSKCMQSLVTNGLADRFRSEENKKNVILRSTDKGRAFYQSEVERFVAPVYQVLFDNLSSFSDEQLSDFAKAINSLSDSLVPNKAGNPALIKIE
jgi:DNA-binding MarR family transcriptional regulator